MTSCFRSIFSEEELAALSNIVSIGEAAYKELMEEEHSVFSHPFLADTCGRIKTKLIQVQCELAAGYDPKFPFEYYQRTFKYGQRIPELRNRKAILHIARSPSPTHLPYPSLYKKELSYNNNPLQRQLFIDLDSTPPYNEDLFYSMLVFGREVPSFSVIQFPNPGFNDIIETIAIPQLSFTSPSLDTKTFERKKAILKKEVLAQMKEDIS